MILVPNPRLSWYSFSAERLRPPLWLWVLAERRGGGVATRDAAGVLSVGVCGKQSSLMISDHPRIDSTVPGYHGKLRALLVPLRSLLTAVAWPAEPVSKALALGLREGPGPAPAPVRVQLVVVLQSLVRIFPNA